MFGLCSNAAIANRDFCLKVLTFLKAGLVSFQRIDWLCLHQSARLTSMPKSVRLTL
jgi:hypothetical protein